MRSSILSKLVGLFSLLFAVNVLAANTISNLTTDIFHLSGQLANSVPYLDANRKLVSSAVTPTELSYVSGVTSPIQTQINSISASTPMTTLGDTTYFSTVAARLAGNTTLTKKFLSQTGTGTVSAAPAWAQPACADLSNGAASCSTDTTNAANISSGTLPALRLPNPSATTAGGILSLAAVSHNFLTSITTSGQPTQAQPACSDLSGVAASCSTDTTNASNITSGTLATAQLPTVPIANGGTGQVTANAGLNALLPSQTTANGLVLGSNGTNTSWVSPPAGSKNYLSAYTASLSSGVANTGNGNAELGATTGWSLGHVATITNGLPSGSITFGSGASVNLVLTATSTNPISQKWSFSYASSAATTAGDFVASDAFFIDAGDQTQTLTWSFKYQLSSGVGAFPGTSANSYAVAIYDVGNSAFVPTTTGNFSMIQGSGVGFASGTFVANASTTKYRIVIYNATATSGASAMLLDDGFVGPSTNGVVNSNIVFSGTQASQAVTANVTDIAFTAVKDSAGAWNGTQFKVSTAGDYLVTQGMVTSASTSIQPYKNGTTLNAFMGSSTVSTGITGSYLYTNCVPGDLLSIRSNGSVTLTSGSISIVAISNTTFAPVNFVAGFLATTSTTAATTSAPFIFTTKVFDFTNSYSTTTGKYTIPTTGWWSFFGSITTATVSFLNMHRNGNLTLGGNIYQAGNNGLIGVNGYYYFNATDTIELRPSVSATAVTSATADYFGAVLISNPSSGSGASPPNAALVVNTSSTAATTSAPFIFTNVVKDDQNCYSVSTGKCTIKLSGLYCAYVGIAGPSGVYTLSVRQTGTIRFTGPQVSNANNAVNGCWPFLVGDTIDVVPSSSETSSGTTGSYFMLTRVGN